ncbi:hypothetical protein HZB88_04345 [archaeon]|nr:hypothetical protein [archaeon]
MSLFDPIIAVAQQTGVFAFYLPFLVTFSLLYGLLKKSGIFGGDRQANALSALIAFSVAFYVIGFTPVGITIGQFLGSFFTQSTVILLTLIVGVMIIFVLQPVWPTGKKIKGYDQQGRPIFEEGARSFAVGKTVGIVLAVVLLFAFLTSGGLGVFGIQQLGTIGGIAISSQDMWF